MDKSQEFNVLSSNDVHAQVKLTMSTLQPEAFDSSRLLRSTDASSQHAVSIPQQPSNLQAPTTDDILSAKPASVSPPCASNSSSQVTTDDDLHKYTQQALNVLQTQLAAVLPEVSSRWYGHTDALCSPLSVELARPSVGYGHSSNTREIQACRLQLVDNDGFSHLIQSKPVILSALRNQKEVVIQWTFPIEIRLFVIKYIIYFTSKLAGTEFFSPWKSIGSVPSLDLPISATLLDSNDAQCIFVVQAFFTNGLWSKISTPVIA